MIMKIMVWGSGGGSGDGDSRRRWRRWRRRNRAPIPFEKHHLFYNHQLKRKKKRVEKN